MSAPLDAAGAPVRCSACGGELRVTSMTAVGSSSACPCGRTRCTVVAERELEFGIVRDSKLTDPES